MLKVLEQYIEGESASNSRYSTDRRFVKILVASVIAHFVFYALIIQLDLMRKLDSSPLRGSRTELILVTEVGPPPKSPPLRTLTEPLERADTRRMEYDPERSNDTDLIARSPKLGNPEGSSNRSTAPKPTAVKPTAESGSSATTQQKPLIVPPVTAPVVAQALPSQIPSLPTSTLKSTSQNIEAPPPASANQSPQSQESRGTRAFSIDEVKSQYRALVRAKILKVNERNMPRDWIRDVLNNEVSADFSIKIGRGGRLLAVTRTRSSGYPTLDSAAREAIYNAVPFEGYPQDAGDEITLTVTVLYAPYYR